MAPADGQLTRRVVSEGETINANQATPVLFEITENDADVSVYAEVPERLVRYVSTGTDVQVRAGVLGGDSLSCLVDRIYRRPVQRANFVYYGLLIGCGAAPDGLWSGMSVDVVLTLHGKADALLVPRSAFLQMPPVNTPSRRRHKAGFEPLWVIGDDGEVSERSVFVGQQSDGVVEILEGDLLETDQLLNRPSDES